MIRALFYVPLTVAALAMAMVASVQAAPAAQSAVRPDVLLVQQPPASVCTGHSFAVGVFFQAISGGYSGYRVGVKNPQGKLILWKTGRAPSSHWLTWTIHPHLIGKYKTTYWFHKTLNAWTPYTATTNSHHC